MRKLLFVLLCSFVGRISNAQQTLYYTHELKEFNAAKELFDREEYQSALQKFEIAQSKILKPTDKMVGATDREIQYYKAVCYAKLNSSLAEKALSEYILNQPISVYTQRANYYLGSIYFKQSQYAKTLESFELSDVGLLNRNEKNNFQFEKGYSLFITGKYDEALPYLKSLANSPKNKYYQDAVYFAAIIDYRKKEFNEAEKGFLKIENTEKYRNTIPYLLAQVYYQQKNYDKVISYLEPKIDGIQADDAYQLRHLLGQSYFEKGKYEKALPQLTSYIEKAKKVTPQEMYQLAFSQYKTGKYKEAITHFLELQFAEEELGQNSMYALADCYLKNNQKKEAKAAFANTAKFNFDKSIKEEAEFNYSKLCFELGEDNEAITGLKKFIITYPASKKIKEAKDLLAQELIHTKNYPEAIELMDEFDEFSKENQLAFQKINYFYAVELYNDGNTEEALKYLDKSINNALDEIIEGKATFLRGEILFAKKQYRKALDEYVTCYQIMMKKGINDENYSNIKALYGKAYCHYLLKEYQNAAMAFTKVLQEADISGDQSVKSQIYQDALLRNADCYFILKNYEAADQYYTLAIDKKVNATDYALLNKATIEGLLKNEDAKISALATLINNYKSSPYLDDALYQLANTYEERGDLKNARAKFNLILERYSNSDYVAKTLLKLGLISFNENNKEEALRYYKQVAEKYPNTSESEQAFKVIKETYLSEGNADQYIEYIESAPNGKKLTASEQDSLLFDAGEEAFAGGDCARTISAISLYLKKFPEGFFATKAHFYRGECLYKDKKFDDALNDYDQVILRGNNPFMEKVLLKSCFILYNQKRNYEKSYGYYKKIKQLASNQQNTQIAQLGLMRTTYYTNKFDENILYSDEILNTKSYSEDIQIEATYYKGKSCFATDKLEMAKPLFETVVKKSSSEKGAESKYLLALIENLKGNYTKSLDICFELKDDFASYEKWVVKTFILIGDNYLKTDDIFQAKATIESLLNNYDGDKTLVEEAKQKLAEIEKKGQEKSKVEFNK